jgi:hypothetical protein
VFGCDVVLCNSGRNFQEKNIAAKTKVLMPISLNFPLNIVTILNAKTRPNIP